MIGYYALRVSFGLNIKPNEGNLVVIQSETMSIDPSDKEKLEHVCLDFSYQQIHNPHFKQFLTNEKSNPNEGTLLPVHVHPVINQYVDTTLGMTVNIPLKPVIERMDSECSSMPPSMEKQKTNEERRKTMWG